MNIQQPKQDCQAIIHNNLPRCRKLYESGIFDLSNRDEHFKLFRESAFTELLVRLNDILQCLDKNGKRVNCSEHIQTSSRIKDITGLISELRNAACHVTSGNRRIKGEDIYFSFNVVKGKGSIIITGDTTHGECEFNDDTAYFYGSLRIYLKRHIRNLLEYLQKLK